MEYKFPDVFELKKLSLDSLPESSNSAEENSISGSSDPNIDN